MNNIIWKNIGNETELALSEEHLKMLLNIITLRDL